MTSFGCRYGRYHRLDTHYRYSQTPNQIFRRRGLLYHPQIYQSIADQLQHCGVHGRTVIPLDGGEPLSSVFRLLPVSLGNVSWCVRVRLEGFAFTLDDREKVFDFFSVLYEHIMAHVLAA